MRCSRNMNEKKKIRHTHLGAAPAELDHDHHIVCSGGDEDNHHNKVACGINFCKMRERMFVLEVLEACRAQTSYMGDNGTPYLSSDVQGSPALTIRKGSVVLLQKPG